MRVKICGITSETDARLVLNAGADALGFIAVASSPRYVDLATLDWIDDLPPFISRVAVVLDPEVTFLEQLASMRRYDTLQLHGSEPEALAGFAMDLGFRVIKAIHPQTAEDWEEAALFPCHAILVDTYDPRQAGGTGRTGDWAAAAAFVKQNPSQPLILSGGLRPANVEDAINTVRPYAIDLSSGVEVSPGRKDPEAITALFKALRKAEHLSA